MRPGESEYDPREWQLHAQTAKIYESLLKKEMGANTFRSPDQRQLRLDAHHLMRHRWNSDAVLKAYRDLVSRAFASTVGPGQKHQWVIPGTRKPSQRATEASQARYHGQYVGSDGKTRTLDDLVNDRQSYEEMLGIVRSDFYRVTEEPTQAGNRYFVWPMKPGQRVPGPGLKSEQAALRYASKLSEEADPRVTERWHVPQCSYTEKELAKWLPPDSVFGALSNPRRPGRSTGFWFWEEMAAK